VAALDYWGRSRLRRFLAADCLGAVLVDRSVRPAADPLRPLAHVLSEGRSLLIFPEGTRGQGEIGAFRAGLFHLARRFPSVQLVPVYLENLQRILPKGSPLIVPLICTLRFGAPCRPEPDEDKAAYLARARATLAALGGEGRAGEVGESVEGRRPR
jgi:1-acyl-sn-glycerol-3-phosphate acyltransferase